MKKRMPELGEAIFCVIYLLFGFISAAVLLTKGQSGAVTVLYGILTLILAGGDSFHLIPRILHAVRGDFAGYEFWAGLGLMISSITMTVFYLVLYEVWALLAAGMGLTIPPVKPILWGLALCRVVLCCFPQNNWFKKEGNQTWGILRNAPFVVLGVLMIALFGWSGLWGMAAAILVSFGCYLPVVLFAKKNPKVGMLMMPKTMAYMWMIWFGLSML